jgi:hypothetical protein
LRFHDDEGRVLGVCGADGGVSGEVTRHRLNPGGDRHANNALWRIVFTRLRSDPATRAYAERRTAEGTKAEIIRCLKRYVAREVYPTSACPNRSLPFTRSGPSLSCPPPAAHRMP